METILERNGPILWAFDPYEGAVRPDASALRALGACAAGNCAPPHLAYVAHTSLGRETVRADLDAYAAALAHLPLGPSEILTTPDQSRRTAVRCLVDAALRERSPLIAVSSHGRSGPGRWLLGSFAERLIETSPVPVLFLSHRRDEVPTAESVAIFATDFTEHSHRAFLEFLALARRAGVAIVLYHDIVLPVACLSDISGAGVPLALPDEYLDGQRQWAGEQARAWEKDAAAAGVHLRSVIEADGANPAVGILDAARREHAVCIALSASDDLGSRLLLGGTARQIFRCGEFPVWLYGPAATAPSGVKMTA